MDPIDWFRKLLKSYRDIVDNDYNTRKALFPYYGPVDVIIF
jgi:hypothetical protein